MAKGKKPKICKKCGELLYCDEHHILPKEIFGHNETVPLCKNCHDKYHRFLGFIYLRKEHAQTEEFYLSNWANWISIIIIFLTIAYFLTKPKTQETAKVSEKTSAVCDTVHNSQHKKVQ